MENNWIIKKANPREHSPVTHPSRDCVSNHCWGGKVKNSKTSSNIIDNITLIKALLLIKLNKWEGGGRKFNIGRFKLTDYLFIYCQYY